MRLLHLSFHVCMRGPENAEIVRRWSDGRPARWAVLLRTAQLMHDRPVLVPGPLLLSGVFA